jgi:tRNA threonylcarbamoyladenosine biosynthesis protein TsaB
MWILCLDSSTEWCSVAVGDGRRWHGRDERAGQSHSERLLPMVSATLAEAGLALPQLDGLAFGAGPGSFTGIRIGCGVVQGLAFGADLPVVAVPTLEALAQEARRRHGWTAVAACLDARMREVYFACMPPTGRVARVDRTGRGRPAGLRLLWRMPAPSARAMATRAASCAWR